MSILSLPPTLPDITEQIYSPYDIFASLAGGFSNVYPGILKSSGQKVAIKFIRVPHVSPEKIKQRFSREANSWHRLLDRPNRYILELVGVVHWGDEKKPPGLVAPFHENNDALGFIKSNNLNEHQKGNILLCIAKGLKHIHDHNVIHGDMKLRNVLFDSHGVPKISDFGLSRILDCEGFATLATSVSYPYTAPEILEKMRADKKKEPEDENKKPEMLTSKKADVYAFAILSAEIFMEKYHRINSNHTHLLAVERGLRPVDTDVKSQKYFPLMRICWDGHPDRRLTSSKMVESLESISRGVSRML
ncbi:hypothetical protein AX15_007860 [Amanita polypyramis BW_CC]|nr:hypothetical protein AX15_007860 [Amanita polypyramis BW_CC]